MSNSLLRRVRPPWRHHKRRTGRRYDVAFYVPRLGPLLTSTETPPTGGAETQIVLLAQELARQGSNALLLVFELPGIAIPSCIGGVAVSVRPPYRAHDALGLLRETVAIGRAIVRADSDVIVSRVAGPEVGLAALFAKMSRRRFVYSSANVSDFDLSQVSPTRRNQQLFRLGIRLADELVVQTEEQVLLCRERFGRSSVLIRSIAEPAPQRDQDAEAFLWIGRLVWYKRPLAFVELARSLPEAQFWMIAFPEPHARDSNLMRRIQESAESLSNLELISPRRREKLMELVDRAVAMVNTADYEGMPNTFLEGWARGVPALALTHDPDGVIERHGLGAFAHGSNEQLVDLARQLWEARTDQTDIAGRCRQYVLEHHSPEVVSARWRETLKIGPGASVGEAALER